MTKFEQMRRSANMLEHACDAIMDAAYESVRWSNEYLEQPEDKFDRFDNKELREHLNEKGLEIIQLAHDVIAKLENAF